MWFLYQQESSICGVLSGSRREKRACVASAFSNRCESGLPHQNLALPWCSGFLVGPVSFLMSPFILLSKTKYHMELFPQ